MNELWHRLVEIAFLVYDRPSRIFLRVSGNPSTNAATAPIIRLNRTRREINLDRSRPTLAIFSTHWKRYI